MKISRGIIKNVNKRLICGVFVLTLLTVPLTGCNAVSISDIKYNNENKMETINYETLEYCSFYTVYNNKTKERYYTIGLRDDFNGSYLVKYYDVFTGKELNPMNYTFNSIEKVYEYLIEKDMLKDTYEEDDLKNILNEFIQEEKDKQLIKVK